MKKTIFLIIILVLTIYVGISWWRVANGKTDLAGTGFDRVFNQSTPVPSPTVAPPNAPKTFDFNSQTDLKAELDKVNPQILDSDFE